MSTPTVSIDRLSATWRGDPRHESRLSALLHDVAGRRLPHDLGGAPLPDGHWCVDHLDLSLSLDLERPDADLASAWSRAITDRVRDATRRQGVVHYPTDLAALVDLLVSVAHHDTSRAWAWRQVGLVDRITASRPHSGSAASESRAVAVAALRLRPDLARPALLEAARSAGLPALHRLLGEAGWQAVSALLRKQWQTPTSTPGDDTHPAAAAERALARSGFARLVLDGHLEAGPLTVAAWSVLVLAETLPPATAPTEPLLAATVEQLAARLRRTLPAPPLPPGGHVAHARGPELEVAPAQPDAAAAAPGERDAPVPPTDRDVELDDGLPAARPRADSEPERPDTTAPDGLPTAWAGLLFLLATATECDVPGRLAAPPLADRPGGWVLHRVGRRVAPVGWDDPALLGLAGLLRDGPPPYEIEPDPAVRRAVRDLAHDWITATAARLRDADPEAAADPVTAVASLAHRSGVVHAGPGWLELTMPLEQVSTTVRRAGLDLDPGWVPWLGFVVRYRYE